MPSSCSTPCTRMCSPQVNPVTPVGKSWKHCITSWHFRLSPFLSFISRTSAVLDYLCSIDENSLQSSLQTVRGFSMSSFWDQSCILTYLTEVGWELLFTEVYRGHPYFVLKAELRNSANSQSPTVYKQDPSGNVPNGQLETPCAHVLKFKIL